MSRAGRVVWQGKGENKATYCEEMYGVGPATVDDHGEPQACYVIFGATYGGRDVVALPKAEAFVMAMAILRDAYHGPHVDVWWDMLAKATSLGFLDGVTCKHCGSPSHTADACRIRAKAMLLCSGMTPAEAGLRVIRLKT